MTMDVWRGYVEAALGVSALLFLQLLPEDAAADAPPRLLFSVFARDRFGKHHNLVVMATLVDDASYRQ
jgi:hypothetical protein